MKTLYQRLVDAGIECSNWQSDLYFPNTAQTREIAAQCKRDGIPVNLTPFRNQVDGSPMLEAPFMFDPFWS